MKLTIKQFSIIGFISCLTVLAAAYYLEYQYMLATCPLCVLQRVMFMALGLVFFVGIILPLRDVTKYIFSGVILLLATSGAALALRQIWLQYFAPPQETTCAASLEHLIDIYPFLEALQIALSGSGECATIDYTIFGLSLAAWSFILFFIGAAGAVWLMCTRKL